MNGVARFDLERKKTLTTYSLIVLSHFKCGRKFTSG
jgi:hypothetical protein